VKLNRGQLRIAAEVFGNISVAWFSIGVIAPLFLTAVRLGEKIVTMAVGLSMAVMFAIFAMIVVGGEEK
jgi:hypothetical protein